MILGELYELQKMKTNQLYWNNFHNSIPAITVNSPNNAEMKHNNPYLSLSYWTSLQTSSSKPKGFALDSG